MWLTYGFCSFCFKRVVSIKIFLLVFYIMFFIVQQPTVSQWGSILYVQAY